MSAQISTMTNSRSYEPRPSISSCRTNYSTNKIANTEAHLNELSAPKDEDGKSPSRRSTTIHSNCKDTLCPNNHDESHTGNFPHNGKICATNWNIPTTNAPPPKKSSSPQLTRLNCSPTQGTCTPRSNGYQAIKTSQAKLKGEDATIPKSTHKSLKSASSVVIYTSSIV